MSATTSRKWLNLQFLPLPYPRPKNVMSVSAGNATLRFRRLLTTMFYVPEGSLSIL